MTTFTNNTSSAASVSMRGGWRGVGFAAAGLAVAIASPLVCAQSENYLTTEPVGFVAVTVQGDSDTRARSNYVTSSLVNPIEWTGEVVTASGNGMTFAAPEWQSGAFSSGYYLEVVSGAYTGIWSDIISSTTDSVTLADRVENYVSAGDKVVIRRTVTIADLFGANNEAGLKSGKSSFEADSIIVYSKDSAKVYWRYDGSTGAPAGWYDGRWQRAENATISHGDGVVIERFGQEPLKIYFTGAAKGGASSFAVDPRNNVFGGVSVADIPLSSSGLYTGNAATGMASGSDPSSTDHLIVYNNSGTPSLYWYYNGQSGGTAGWYDGRWKPAPDAFIPAGSVFSLQRLNGDAFQWFIPSQIN